MGGAGTGGSAGSTSGGNGGNGGNTTSVCTGAPTLTGTGGLGATAAALDYTGKSPGDRTQGSLTMIGGGEVQNSQPGAAPGGGGGGGISTFAAGGAGARGQASYLARQ